MPSTLPPELLEPFKAALRHIVRKDKGFVPDEESFQLVDALRPAAVVEVILHDNDGRFALMYRDDASFKGYHFSGGRFSPKGETVQEACRRNLRMDGLEGDVTDFRVIAVHAYQPGEHPYSLPVVMLVACRLAPGAKLIESDKCRWFSECPPDIIQNAPHTKYVEVFQRWFKAGNLDACAEIF